MPIPSGESNAAYEKRSPAVPSWPSLQSAPRPPWLGITKATGSLTNWLWPPCRRIFPSSRARPRRRTGSRFSRARRIAGATLRLPLKHFNEPDHYLDLEQLADYGLKPEMLARVSLRFRGQLALARQAHPKSSPRPTTRKTPPTRTIWSASCLGHHRELRQVESGFSYLKAFEAEGGTPAESPTRKPTSCTSWG